MDHTQGDVGLELQKAVGAICLLSPGLNPFLSLCSPRVTLYAEFLPMKARAKCILLIEVRRVAGLVENSQTPA